MEQKKVYVIFGGTGGIGSQVARRLAADGATVVLAARGSDRLDALSANLGGAETHQVDATDIGVDGGLSSVRTKAAG